MGHHSRSTFRIFLISVLMLIVTSIIITCVTSGCFHWIATAAAIMVLYRVARGGR